MSIEAGKAAAETYVRSIRTGEHAASLALARLLDKDVVLETNGPMPNAPTETIKGYEAVLTRASGNWAWTYALRNARWGEARAEAGGWRIEGSCAHIGSVAPELVSVLVTTGAQGKITRIEQKYTPKQAQPTDQIPLSARPLINNARVNETPIAVAYTDENGNPSLTFRGSIQVLDGQRLCAWIRVAEGSLVRSIARNPTMSLIYRDGPRAMLLMQGRARIDNSQEMKDYVYELTPEQEQNHDTQRKGVALIIELDKMMGYVGGESVRMARKA